MTTIDCKNDDDQAHHGSAGSSAAGGGRRRISTCARFPEFEQGHPEGAFNIPLLHLDPPTGRCGRTLSSSPSSAPTFRPRRTMVIGCKMGGRSAAGVRDSLERRLSRTWPTCSAASAARRRWATPAGYRQGLPVEAAADAAREYEALHKKAAGAADRVIARVFHQLGAAARRRRPPIASPRPFEWGIEWLADQPLPAGDPRRRAAGRGVKPPSRTATQFYAVDAGAGLRARRRHR